MNKQYLLESFVISALLIPVLASAATADEIRTQIQALLNQITVLQDQLKGQTTEISSMTTPSVPVSIGGCPHLYRTLSRGSRGSDVVSLQQFLIAQKLLSGDSATGFFGAMTEAAVQRWQAQNSIVSSGNAATSGYGTVGAKTRAAIMNRCNTSTVKNPQCPTRPPAPCAPGTTLTWDTDANGCRVNDRCVASKTENSSCVPDGVPVCGRVLAQSCKGTQCYGWSEEERDYSDRCALNAAGGTFVKYGKCFDIPYPYPTSGIRIISPNGGETLKDGERYTIRWDLGEWESYIRAHSELRYYLDFGFRSEDGRVAQGGIARQSSVETIPEILSGSWYAEIRRPEYFDSAKITATLRIIIPTSCGPNAKCVAPTHSVSDEGDALFTFN